MDMLIGPTRKAHESSGMEARRLGNLVGMGKNIKGVQEIPLMRASMTVVNPFSQLNMNYLDGQCLPFN